mgnify:CR=1 FL=1
MAQIYLCYAHKDRTYMERLSEKLSTFGITTSLSEEKETLKALSSAKIFVIFLSKNILSEYISYELEAIVLKAKNRNKFIIPIAQWGESTLSSIPDSLKKLFEYYQYYFPEDGLHSETDYNELAMLLYDVIEKSLTKELLYSKLVALKQIGYTEGIIINLSKLIVLLFHEVSQEKDEKRKVEKYVEICQNIIELHNMTKLYSDQWIEKLSRELGREVMKVVSLMRQNLDSNSLNTNQIITISIAIIYISCMIDLWIFATRTLTYGDVQFPDQNLLQKYISERDQYCTLYTSSFEQQQSRISKDYTYVDIQIILSAPEYFNLSFDKSFFEEKPTTLELSKEALSEKEQKLWEIAEHIQKSNLIFDFIGEKEKEVQFLRCLKTSYERLLKFSKISGCTRVCAECAERIEEIKQSLELLDNDEFSNTTSERAIRALLGFTVIEDQQYDVFISHEHSDLDIAQQVFHHLQQHLLYPFLDKESLPEIGKSEYESAIMHSLENSKHFIVVLSNLEHLQSHWVELEMRTFHHEMADGRKLNSNFLILATDNVYDEIIATNKKCIDIRYRSYEIIRFSQYKDIIIEYLK